MRAAIIVLRDKPVTAKTLWVATVLDDDQNVIFRGVGKTAERAYLEMLRDADVHLGNEGTELQRFELARTFIAENLTELEPFKVDVP